MKQCLLWLLLLSQLCLYLKVFSAKSLCLSLQNQQTYLVGTSQAAGAATELLTHSKENIYVLLATGICGPKPESIQQPKETHKQKQVGRQYETSIRL